MLHINKHSMKGMIGWLVAAAVVIAAAAYYFNNQPAAVTSTSDETQVMPTQTEVSQGSASESMSGTWRSDSDAKFTRELRSDGVIIDRYEGDATPGINGEWSIVNPTQEPAITAIAASFPNKTVVKAEWEGGVEVTYFVISDVTATKLVTTDLSGRGVVTTYTKVSTNQ